MISPLLWSSLSYQDETAWLDFLFQHEATHRELAKLTKTRMVLMDDLRDNLMPHGDIHNALARSVLLTPIRDLVNYDLQDEGGFYSFISVHAQDHARLAQAAGLI